ncbi:thiol reductant ABC exporter subunit CydC [Bordetella petrii]|uniref:thiol reductant ABC exporter subunit CydC n=1 Tax=Bordetella petrii TaxID=94624 RepID=UPI000491A71B|nr:thiol reductant ABC exporter subunit CydC [Bordetella petrii]
MRSLRLLLPLYRRRWHGLLAALALALLTIAAGVGLLGVSGWFLSAAALAGAGTAFNLFVPSALVRLLSFLRIASRYAERLVGHAATLRLLTDLRTRVFDALVRLTPRQLARYRGGDLVARLTGDVDALDTVFLHVLAPVATAAAAGALLAGVLGYRLPVAGAILALAMGIVTLAIPAWLALAARRPGLAAQESLAALRAATLEAVQGHADLVALHAAGQARARFAGQCAAAARARDAQARTAAAGLWLLQVAAGGCVVAVLWFGLDALARGELGGPLLAGLLLAVLGLFEVAGPLMRGAARLGGAVAAAGRIGAVMQQSPDQRDPAAPQALPVNGAVEFQQVHFAYPAADGQAGPAVLDGIDLRIAPGERVAIIGPSGAGKSTLLQLLLRLEDPRSGRVSFGGVDVRHAAQAELHRRVAWLSQDAPVFLGTLRTNLLIGAPGAADAALWSALDAAHLGEFVRSLPDGLDTWVGETGASLSAGQARRLCLARALLSPAPVLALDEPTAGLDMATQEAFFRDLAGAARGRTVILVTHASLPPDTVDRCLRLRGGRLAAADLA